MKLQDLDLSGFVEYAFELLPGIYTCIKEKWKKIFSMIKLKGKVETHNKETHTKAPKVLPLWISGINWT